MKVLINECKRILPLGKNAPIKYDLMLYMEMEALLSNPITCDSAKAWYMTNYTQLYCLKADKIIANKGAFYKNVHICQPKNPFIKERITSVFFLKSSSILNFVISQISKGNYVKILLDHFYLPKYKFYNCKHIYHTEFIYGYDLEKSILYVIGSTNLRMGGFERTEIEFSDFVKSYESSKKAKPFKSITALIIRERKKYKFNFDKFYKGLLSYFNSVPQASNRLCVSNDKHSFFKKYGLNAYDELCNVLKDEFYVSKRCTLKSIKYLQAFADYKKLMLQRIEFLYRNNFLTQKNFEYMFDTYTEFVNEFNVIISLYIKNFITYTHKNADKIIDKLLKLKEDEKACLVNMISDLCMNHKNNKSKKLRGDSSDEQFPIVDKS